MLAFDKGSPPPRENVEAAVKELAPICDDHCNRSLIAYFDFGKVARTHRESITNVPRMPYATTDLFLRWLHRPALRTAQKHPYSTRSIARPLGDLD